MHQAVEGVGAEALGVKHVSYPRKPSWPRALNRGCVSG